MTLEEKMSAREDDLGYWSEDQAEKKKLDDLFGETIATHNAIIQWLTRMVERTDDDQRIINLTCVIAKANRSMSNLAAARMCYRAIGKEDDSGGDADV